VIADLVVRGGTVVTPEAMWRGGVAVRDGRIVAIDRDDALPQARETFDAAGLHVLPGVIDTHVRRGDPGVLEREDWLTGTRAAAAGGRTTILEMPIANPPVNAAAILRERATVVGPRSLVDFALYAGESHDNLEEIAAMAEAEYVMVAPHNPLGPVGSIATLHLSARTVSWLDRRPQARLVVDSVWNTLTELEAAGHHPRLLAAMRFVLVHHEPTAAGRCRACRRGSWRSPVISRSRAS